MPPTTNDFSVNNVWGSNLPTGEMAELTTPSGQTCRARKLGMEGLIEAGILANADSLTALVQTKHVAKGKQPKVGVADMQKIMKDPKGLSAMIELCDRALPYIVVSPVVHRAWVKDDKDDRVPLSLEERQQVLDEKPGTVFTDQIDMTDKFWLFQWAVGDMGATEPFRGSTGDDVGDLADGAGIPLPAQRPVGNRAQRRGSKRR